MRDIVYGEVVRDEIQVIQSLDALRVTTFETHRQARVLQRHDNPGIRQFGFVGRANGNVLNVPCGLALIDLKPERRHERLLRKAAGSVCKNEDNGGGYYNCIHASSRKRKLALQTSFVRRMIERVYRIPNPWKQGCTRISTLKWNPGLYF